MHLHRFGRKGVALGSRLMEYGDAWPASAAAYELGEGPLWDAPRNRVVWVDIPSGRVMAGSLTPLPSGQVDLSSPAPRPTITEEFAMTVDRTVGAAVISEAGDWLIAGHTHVHLRQPDGTPVSQTPVITSGQASRLNDGACDPAGRFLVGSLALDGRTGAECLWQRNHDGNLTVLDDNLTLSNGLAWDTAGTTLFSIDSIPGHVWRRPYDPNTGQVGARALAFAVTDGIPDGMCVDAEDNLWIAIWGAGEVRRYHPSGRLLGRIRVTAPHTTSVAFVGPQRDHLLITTAYAELTAEQHGNWPDSGRLFLADPQVCGAAVTTWRGPR